MADVRPGPPQWPLMTSTQNRSTYAPRTPFVPPAMPRTAPAATPRPAPPATPRNMPRTMPPAAPPIGHSEPRPRRHNGGPRHATGEWRTIPSPETRRRTRRLDKSPWHWLLWIPIVVPLSPALYNRIEPTLLGLPFFYWGQLAFAFLASGVVAFVHRRVR